MSYLFVFHKAPDIDHMAPLAWRLLEDGDEVHGVISPGYAPAGDYRLRHLRGYARFHLHETWPPTRRRGPHAAFDWGRGYLRNTLPAALWRLVRIRPALVAVEWGYGLASAYEHMGSPRGALALVRALGRSLARAGSDPLQTRTSMIVAARLLRIPVVCLPHGLSVKLDAATSEAFEALLRDGPIDWSDRNRFAAYVLNTEHHRQWHFDHAKGDPRAMETWGSLRWAPEWFELNRSLAPPFRWPEDGGERLRLVYMVPKWPNRVDAPAAVELLRRVQALDDVSVAVMGHPRGRQGSSDPLHADPAVDWERLHDVSGANSVALIAAADVIIDIGSSIGIEVVMQEKVLVNPSYLHGLTTFFDTIDGTCVVAHSADEVVDYLAAHAAGSPHEVGADAYDELMRHAVYGSEPEPFDVLARYRDRIRALAGASVPRPVATSPPTRTRRS